MSKKSGDMVPDGSENMDPEQPNRTGRNLDVKMNVGSFSQTQTELRQSPFRQTCILS